MKIPSKRTEPESDPRFPRLMRSRPSSSTAVALAALFVALSGVAIAAQVASGSGGEAPAQAQASGNKKKKKKKKKAPVRAGGALTGTYPSPSLNVSGGDNGPDACQNGEALVGVSALAALSCSTGVYSDDRVNVAAVPSAFPSLTTGQQNSALGSQALLLDSTGSENSAFGEFAMTYTTTGTRNSAFGQAALALNETGDENSAFGEDAILINTTGSNNSAFGMHALDSNTTGTDNVALGHRAGTNLTTGSDNVEIANAGVAGEAGTTRIGTEGTQTSAYIAGVSGTNLGAVPNVVVDANGQLGVNASSERFKTDIKPLRSLHGLMKLRPVSFRYRSSEVRGPNPPEFGLLAEQVAAVYPNLVARDKDGKPYTVLYQQLPALLLASVQRQQRQNRSLRAENRRQQAQIDKLMRIVGRG
jgi:Chaperone of endosialidase